MKTTMDKEQLAAFVDGELAPEEAAAIVLHLADHPSDQAYVDDLFAANSALARAFAAPLSEPVPEPIRAAIHSGTTGPVVVAFRRRPVFAMAGLALAASVAAAAILLPGIFTGSSTNGIALGPLGPEHPVTLTFESRPSGDPVVLQDGREAMVIASFAMPDGRFCRELELIDRAQGRLDYALGCRRADGWRIEGVIAEAIVSQPEDGFVPAGDTQTEALTRLLEREGTPLPLDAEAEADAIRKGWIAP